MSLTSQANDAAVVTRTNVASEPAAPSNSGRATQPLKPQEHLLSSDPLRHTSGGHCTSLKAAPDAAFAHMDVSIYVR